jgi:predicted Zn-dependent protease with MMP-like domain
MTTGITTGPQDSPELNEYLDLAEDALDRGDPGAALSLCDQVLAHVPDHPGAMFLTAEAYRDLRDLEESEARYRRVLQTTPDHAASWSGLGTVLFDLLDFEPARNCVLRAIRLDPACAEAYYWRAMLRERRGDYRGADRDYRRACRLDPELFPMPVELADATLEAVVEDAIRELHPSIRVYLSQVPILLDEVPDLETCLDFDPPAPPGEILGYFSGYSLQERTLENPWSNLPSAIVLFRRNLQRIANDREHLLRELRITVFHEVGHYLGLDEEDLEVRGLD